MPFMAPCVFNYICTGRLTSVDVPLEHIPDPTLKFILEKVDTMYVPVQSEQCMYVLRESTTHNSVIITGL